MTPETILRSENERLRAFIRSLQDPERFGHAVTREVREAAQRELARVPVMPEPLTPARIPPAGDRLSCLVCGAPQGHGGLACRRLSPMAGSNAFVLDGD